ncbi:hypothetical protein [Ponticaulis profundi]|uniref:Uncharacterized protein n=1 Tax=Ponticaulis profundi TaxID=2665222 RepID=A0ABW1S8S6_9PROT
MGNGSKAEMLIAVCAVISSIAAVYIAWDQARVMRSQEKADVWPILQTTHQTDVGENGNIYAFELRNAGVGPALIDNYLIRIPGEGDTQEFNKLVDYLMPEEMGVPTRANTSLSGRVMRQGDKLSTVRAAWPGTPDITEAIQSRIDEFLAGERQPAEVFICYCSILDDCWVTSTMTDNLRPTEVKACTELTSVANKLMPPSTEMEKPKEAQE